MAESNEEIQPTFTLADIKELGNHKENIEDSDEVSDESKEKIEKKQEKEKEEVEKSKPKLIIRIPIPYTDKYITIKLGALFAILGGAALALLALTLLSKLTSSLGGSFPVQEIDYEADQDNIKKELNEIDIDEINDTINKALSGLGSLGGVVSDTSTSVSNDSTSASNDSTSVTEDIEIDNDTDEDNGTSSYTKPKKQNKNKKKPFSYDNRDRVDVLDSSNVKNRNPQDKGNKNNNNYGQYY